MSTCDHVFIVFDHAFCSGPLGHIVFSISWLLPLSCPSVVFASAQSASGGYPVYTQLYSIAGSGSGVRWP